MNTLRALKTGIVVAVLLQCAVWLLTSFIYWLFQNGIVSPNTPQEVAQAQAHAVAALAAAVINVIAVAAFATRSGGYGLWLLAAVQVADLAGALIVISSVPDPHGAGLFQVISATAALILFLIAALWWVSRSLRGGEAASRNL